MSLKFVHCYLWPKQCWDLVILNHLCDYPCSSWVSQTYPLSKSSQRWMLYPRRVNIFRKERVLDVLEVMQLQLDRASWTHLKKQKQKILLLLRLAGLFVRLTSTIPTWMIPILPESVQKCQVRRFLQFQKWSIHLVLFNSCLLEKLLMQILIWWRKGSVSYCWVKICQEVGKGFALLWPFQMLSLIFGVHFSLLNVLETVNLPPLPTGSMYLGFMQRLYLGNYGD